VKHSPRALAWGFPAERVRIGLVTPSSNSVVEPITSAIVSRLIKRNFSDAGKIACPEQV